MNPFGRMYLRPGNLWRPFQIWEMSVENVNGRAVESRKKKGSFLGILADADTNVADRMKHRLGQEQHALTHTLVARGQVKARKGDMLKTGDRSFVVLLHEDPGGLGASAMLYLEERNDVK